MNSSLADYFWSGGTLSARAPSYIERAVDRELVEVLVAGEYAYVLDTRQIGKSSLVIRTREALREQGIRVALIDLTRSGTNLNPGQWYLSLLARVDESLGMGRACVQAFAVDSERPPMERFFDVLENVALAADPSPLVVVVDEIDVVLSLPFSADEFFAGIRECFVRRSVEPELNRLSFCLVGSASPASLIRNVQITPFNIGVRVLPTDFTLEELAPYTEEFSSSGRNGDALVRRVHHWTNGHPYLTQLLCGEIARDGSLRTAHEVDRLVESLFLSPSATEADHVALIARRILESSEGQADRGALLDVLSQTARKPMRDDPADANMTVLKLAGVVRASGGHLTIRNRLYGTYFGRRWIEENMPDAELLRRRKAVRAAQVRVGGIAGGVGVALACLAALAFAKALEANTQRERNRKASQVISEQQQDIAGKVTQLQAAYDRLAKEQERVANSAYSSNLLRASEALRLGRPKEATQALELARGASSKGPEYWLIAGQLPRIFTSTYQGRGNFERYIGLAASHDGKIIATITREDGLRIYDAASGNLGASLQKVIGTSVNFRPISSELAIGSYDIGEVGSVAILQDLKGTVRVRKNIACQDLLWDSHGTILYVLGDSKISALRGTDLEVIATVTLDDLPNMADQRLSISHDNKVIVEQMSGRTFELPGLREVGKLDLVPITQVFDRQRFLAVSTEQPMSNESNVHVVIAKSIGTGAQIVKDLGVSGDIGIKVGSDAFIIGDRNYDGTDPRYHEMVTIVTGSKQRAISCFMDGVEQMTFASNNLWIADALATIVVGDPRSIPRKVSSRKLIRDYAWSREDQEIPRYPMSSSTNGTAGGAIVNPKWTIDEGDEDEDSLLRSYTISAPSPIKVKISRNADFIVGSKVDEATAILAYSTLLNNGNHSAGLLSAGQAEGFIYDTKRGEVLFRSNRVTTGDQECVWFSDDNSRCLVVRDEQPREDSYWFNEVRHNDPRTVEIWDVKTGLLLCRLTSHVGPAGWVTMGTEYLRVFGKGGMVEEFPIWHSEIWKG